MRTLGPSKIWHFSFCLPLTLMLNTARVASIGSVKKSNQWQLTKATRVWREIVLPVGKSIQSNTKLQLWIYKDVQVVMNSPPESSTDQCSLRPRLHHAVFVSYRIGLLFTWERANLIYFIPFLRFQMKMLWKWYKTYKTNPIWNRNGIV